MTQENKDQNTRIRVSQGQTFGISRLDQARCRAYRYASKMPDVLTEVFPPCSVGCNFTRRPGVIRRCDASICHKFVCTLDEAKVYSHQGPQFSITYVYTALMLILSHGDMQTFLAHMHKNVRVYTCIHVSVILPCYLVPQP
jgi:hypothetical protein